MKVQAISKITAGSVLALACVLMPAMSASAATETVNSTIRVHVNSAITVGVSAATVDINVTPTAAGATASAAHNVTVGTNNASGYKLQLASSTAATTLEKGSDTIPAAAGSFATPAALTTDTWGYRIDSFAANQYAGITANTAPVTLKNTTTPSIAGGDITAVTWGANVSTATPNGTYTREVTYTAVTN